MKNSENNNMIMAGIYVLWGGLVVIGLVMSVWGILIFNGAASGTKLMFPVGAIVLIRSALKILTLRKQARLLSEAAESAEASETAEIAEALQAEEPEDGGSE